ncbi:snRNA-activating protein complex subunit 1-like [Genypterus blacodes]|uniref:snRNA-activating protein complex subunit 1-like n=1 Tax=Genypterus blacodes TaxID=154954 RepID=UPI003F76A0BB
MPILPLYSDTFWEPLTEDVEELLSRFQQMDSVRYEVFTAVWREMSFSDVFLGLPVLSEAKRFCRIAMTTAVKYFLPPYSYTIRVGGLYLIYGFYHTQSSPLPVNIRLALKDWEHVQKFLNDSTAAGHLDVVYILQKLINSKAIHYTAIQHFLTFQKQVHPKKEPMCAEFLGRTTGPQELISIEVLEELTHIQRQYQGMKEAIGKVRSDIAMIHGDLATRLKDCTLGFIQWQEKMFPQHDQKKKSKDDGAKPDRVEVSRAKLLSSIKQKSYSSFPEMSKSRRHRQAETVDSSSSGVEQYQETTAVKRKRPPTLRARTCQSLSVT